VTNQGEETRAQKQALRTGLLARRETMTDADRSAAGLGLAGQARTAWPTARAIAIYLAIGGEPPTGPAIEAFRRAGARVLVPVVDGDLLDWAAYDEPAILTRGSLGIPEPLGDRVGDGAIAQADVVLVPALAVDRSGNRLGRGRGYYDRTLAAVTAPVVAVVYDEERLESIPVEAHDVAVDGILTPSELVWIR
jgi:5-formyltetrahydrofolate cyclo-ligase